MKTNLILIAAAFALACAQNSLAEDAPKPSVANHPKDAPTQAASAQPKLSQEELESVFKATLTKATLTGRWCSISNGQLGPEKEEKYTINSVTKLGGDMWLITARIQYGKKDFVAPVPVQVKWAGDTPVIILDKVGVAGSGEYSARVMVYQKTYAGTWNGGDHGGLLNGLITSEKD